MGRSYQVACKECGHRCEINVGGGITFQLLHCTRCGKEKSVAYNQIRIDNYRGERMSVEAYKRRVRNEERRFQRVAGSCRCGGSFTVRANPRCPKCRSTRLEDTGEGAVLYD